MPKIGYARISTTQQSHASQVEALRDAGCTIIVRETASGAKTERPRLADLMSDLSSGDTLVVVRLDRLARSLRHLIDLVQTLDDRGVALVSLNDQIDTTTASGKLIFHLFGAMAEFERNLIQERTQAGLEAARAAGRTGGRPHSLTDAQLEKARQWLKTKTMTQEEAAGALGVARSTLSRSLASR